MMAIHHLFQLKMLVATIDTILVHYILSCFCFLFMFKMFMLYPRVCRRIQFIHSLNSSGVITN